MTPVGPRPLCVAGMALGDIHLPSFHVAGVAQLHIHRRFAGQAMYTWHWVTRLGLVKARAARATPVTPRHFCMAGVAQTEILRPVKCLCNCCRCPSSERLGRRTGACLTARQSVMQSMTPGARVLTQCGKKRMQMRGEPTFIWKNRAACVFLNCAVG